MPTYIPSPPRAPTYRSGLAQEKVWVPAPRDSVFRPGRKVCAMQRRRRGEGVGTSWGGGRWVATARRARVSVPPAICESVGARGSRAPARCALRLALGALQLQSRRAPAAASAAAARPPATLPLPLNSCAKYAALHLWGKPRGP